ncbi:bacterial-type non-ribosomal peptide synthetase, putative, partial [Bodo saltans]
MMVTSGRTTTTVAPPSPPQQQQQQQQQLTAEELQTVLDWNYSEFALPPHRAPLPDETVGHIFEQLARRAPSRLALVAEDDTHMTYSQVLDKANAMSRCLLMNAAKNEETGNLLPACVLVALQRTAALPIALLATVRSGLAYWGVDMVLQSAPVVQKNMKALNVRTMIVDSDTFALLFPDGTSPPPPELSVLMVSASGDVVYYRSSQAAVASSAYLCPMRTMYIEFTSGSTGQPKAVAVPHKACISYLRNSGAIYRWGTETRSLLYHSVSFD